MKLKRSVNLPNLVLYGLGTMVGGGFYALLGKVAGEAGMATPLAMALAGILAMSSAFSFGELSSRYPFSAGEAHYIREGFGRVSLSTMTGWLVILTGVVSAATLTVASVGFLQDRLPLDQTTGILLLILIMAVTAIWGVGQSVIAVAAITIIEVVALLYVFGVNAGSLAELPARFPEVFHPGKSSNGASWSGVFAGSFLAFYAFIGFEDMVNMAEEVKDVRRTLPRAILISIGLSTTLYIVVSLVAVLSVPVEKLARSATPVAELAMGQGWFSRTGVWLVSILTGLNGALVQIVMASRVAYGMASRNQAPSWLGIVNETTRTPLYATVVVSLVIAALALTFPLLVLAKVTSSIILLVFAGVNFALWKIKGQNPDLAGEGPRYPRWLPLTGFIVSLATLLIHTGLVLL